MTDRELLELAAKAAKREDYTEWVEITDRDSEHFGEFALSRPGFGNQWDAWNPLESSSQAFELAVKLGHIVDTHGMHSRVSLPYEAEMSLEPHKSDPYAATRRAIVREAPRLGKQMIEEEKSK